MDKLLAPMDSATPFEFAGVKFQQTTTAPTASIGGNTYYNTYLFADDAISMGIFDGQPSLQNKANSVNLSYAA